MKASLKDIEPGGLYSAAQAIELTGMCRKTFYNYVKSGRIPAHKRMINGRKCYKGHELIEALTRTVVAPPFDFGERPRRGRRKLKVES